MCLFRKQITSKDHINTKMIDYSNEKCQNRLWIKHNRL
jgi:hypothetical protein